MPIDLDLPLTIEEAMVLPESPAASEEAVVIPDTPVQAVTEELGGVAVDSVKLFELQLQLFETECKQSVQRLVQPFIVLTAGMAVGTASLMVLFHALGWALHDIFGLSVSLSLLIVSIAGIAGAAIAFQVVRNQLKMPRVSFAKSKAELVRNIACLANIMGSSPR